ncbi:gag-Pol polyprotein [Caerostris darwini]|uniref:Gag-Pol polyprotein n=1 Tax=Caerostris darwini TaxID=1538125 RepID=A0AAV4R027_9ARAC|nr:gag-Pol polyprotein [Caerostris darwini]
MTYYYYIHDHSSVKPSSIRFTVNSSKSVTTRHAAAYLQFGLKLRTIDDVFPDLKAVLDNKNFIPEMTQCLKCLGLMLKTVKECVKIKSITEKPIMTRNIKIIYFIIGLKVWVVLHPISNVDKMETSKFMPKWDGAYVILTQRSPVTYQVANLGSSDTPIGTYHISILNPFTEVKITPIRRLRKTLRKVTLIQSLSIVL